MRNVIQRTKNFVHRNKTAIVVAAITIPVVIAQANGIKKLNEFLTEKDLFNEYYLPED